jgi:hypothetical protein
MLKVEGSCSEFEMERVSQSTEFLNAEFQNEINKESEDEMKIENSLRNSIKSEHSDFRKLTT